MAKITIVLACAYCMKPISVALAGQTIARGGMLARAGKLHSCTCPHCDSSFELHLASKRKRPGKRFRLATPTEATKV